MVKLIFLSLKFENKVYLSFYQPKQMLNKFKLWQIAYPLFLDDLKLKLFKNLCFILFPKFQSNLIKLSKLINYIIANFEQKKSFYQRLRALKNNLSLITDKLSGFLS